MGSVLKCIFFSCVFNNVGHCRFPFQHFCWYISLYIARLMNVNILHFMEHSHCSFCCCCLYVLFNWPVSPKLHRIWLGAPKENFSNCSSKPYYRLEALHGAKPTSVRTLKSSMTYCIELHSLHLLFLFIGCDLYSVDALLILRIGQENKI